MKWLLAVLVVLPCIARAQDAAPASPLLSVPGVADAVAVYAKQARAVTFSNFQGRLGAGALLPLRTLKDGAGVRYAALCIGGSISQGEHMRGKGALLLDLSSIFRRVESRSSWYEGHVDKIKLPDFWFGPNLDAPMPGDAVTWRDFGDIKTWAQYSGVALSMAF